MNKLLYIVILICLSFKCFGQNFDVPSYILDNLESRQFEYTYTAKFNYKVVYPANFDSLATYKVLLGLSGGNASEKIVNYCYYTLFDSDYFDNYITIMPLGPSGKSLADMDSTEINRLIYKITENHNVTTDNWIVAGTSMGGYAAFNFANARPELFEGIITFPGGFRNQEISDKWKNYKVLLAVGEVDEERYITLNEKTKAKLEGNVKSVETFTIKGQGHIIAPAYDIDQIYSKYFIEKN